MSKKSSKLISVEEFKMIRESELPIKESHRSKEWLIWLKSIPEGMAVLLESEKIGINPENVRGIVNKLKKDKKLSDNYYVTRITIDGKKKVYVVNSIKTK